MQESSHSGMALGQSLIMFLWLKKKHKHGCWELQGFHGHYNSNQGRGRSIIGGNSEQGLSYPSERREPDGRKLVPTGVFLPCQPPSWQTSFTWCFCSAVVVSWVIVKDVAAEGSKGTMAIKYKSRYWQLCPSSESVIDQWDQVDKALPIKCSNTLFESYK